MWQKLVSDATVYESLEQIDRELAEAVRARGCRVCGAALHVSTYPRKPRGLFRVEDARRFSFCCSTDGCRKRHTPPSVRYLGRRVFWSVVVVLISALTDAATPRRTRALREHVGVSRRTWSRWRRWWTTQLPGTEFWRQARARFAEPVDPVALPSSLLARFAPPDRERVVSTLRFLAPLSTSLEMHRS